MDTILSVKNLKKTFDGITAVDGCTLDVEKGTITGLIGPNGAGKTTLFNIITGFYKPDSGEIVFKNKKIDQLPTYKITHQGLVRTFQITKALNRMKVIENLMLSPKKQTGESLIWPIFNPKKVGKEEEEIRDKAMELLEFFDLMELKDEYAGALSGGQKKLLELARALMTDPDMILLDEVFAGVNPTLSNKLLDYIKELRDDGVTFFLIEHDIPLVMEACQEVYVMSEGKVIAKGEPEEIKNDQKVLDAYLGVVHEG
ncbi:MAG: ABC-type branched-chain amino acid transport system, ATPase component [Candidatus Methanohalarchaeum thermophilum]|uniref:Probable branched-chain amino acid transport ATP-binding protein LivG n=1 Tax=Methanohalarchaeum thermophilum TaxID=1903181 RepID=A0A1Q6DXK4_METT1|nr:MAG: ABC-type branched-chain amino acid transport system, ATPase component [Candidatus Methanohalarchaeum thermophilum]